MPDTHLPSDLPDTALLARIEAELEARRTLRFENAAKNVPPLYRGMRDEDV